MSTGSRWPDTGRAGLTTPPTFHKATYATPFCKRNIEMTLLCKIEVTHPRVLGSREARRGGVVDEQAGVQTP
jgi:hypothetical protein